MSKEIRIFREAVPPGRYLLVLSPTTLMVWDEGRAPRINTSAAFDIAYLIGRTMSGWEEIT